jgi:uncharacterized protein
MLSGPGRNVARAAGSGCPGYGTAMESSYALLTIGALVGIVVGIVGVVVPVLPGLLLCWASVLVWALFSDGGAGRWVVLGVVTVWVVLGSVVKYAWPGRRLKDAGIPTRTLLVGVAGALIGMFVVPVVGLPLGFVAGIWVAEWFRFGDAAAAWPSTRQAVLGAGLSVLIELCAAALVLGTFLVGLLLV